MYFITTKRMLEVCFSAPPNIQYRTDKRGFLAGYCMKSSFCRLMAVTCARSVQVIVIPF